MNVFTLISYDYYDLNIILLIKEITFYKKMNVILFNYQKFLFFWLYLMYFLFFNYVL